MARPENRSEARALSLTLPIETFKAQWANHIGFTVVDPSEPNPPNRMGAPERLFLTPSDQALRAAAAVVEVRPRP